jgi:hypothetical protein
MHGSVGARTNEVGGHTDEREARMDERRGVHG